MTARTFLLGSAAALAVTALLTATAKAEAGPVPLTPAATAPAVQTGDAPIAGYGNRLPLRAVLSAIVPPGVTVQVEQGVDQYQTASWRGGDSWHKALDAALAPLDLAATYSGRGLEIVQIKLVGAAAAPTLRPWERAELWYAEPNRDLQDVAREWGRRVGVTPVFRGDYSYPVEVPLTFRGTFADAMNYLIKAFSTASPPPLIHQWADQDNFAVQIILGNP